MDYTPRREEAVALVGLSGIGGLKSFSSEEKNSCGGQKFLMEGSRGILDGSRNGAGRRLVLQGMKQALEGVRSEEIKRILK